MRFPRFIALSLSLLLPAIVQACGWWPSHSGEVLLYRIMPLDEAEYYDYAVLWSPTSNASSIMPMPITC